MDDLSHSAQEGKGCFRVLVIQIPFGALLLIGSVHSPWKHQIVLVAMLAGIFMLFLALPMAVSHKKELNEYLQTTTATGPVVGLFLVLFGVAAIVGGYVISDGVLRGELTDSGGRRSPWDAAFFSMILGVGAVLTGIRLLFRRK